MNCSQYADWLQLSVDGRLDAAQQRSLDAHLAVCAECQHDYALLEEVRDALAMPVVGDVDLTAALQRVLDHLKGSLDSLIGLALPQAGLRRDLINEFGLRHLLLLNGGL